jgi:hypothetical protein
MHAVSPKKSGHLCIPSSRTSVSCLSAPSLPSPGIVLSLLQYSIVKLPSAVSPIRSGISCSSGNVRSVSSLSAPPSAVP